MSFTKLCADKLLRLQLQIDREFCTDVGLFQYLHYIANMRRYTEGLIEKYKGVWVEHRYVKSM